MKRIDFENDTVTKNIINAAFPLLVAQIMSLLYNVVDRIYIARIPSIGTYALGAIGLCFPLIVIINAFANLFGSGGAPLFSISRGEKNSTKANLVMNTSFTMLVLCSIVLMIVLYPLLKPILTLFGTSTSAMKYAYPYMMIYLIGTLPSMPYFGYESIYQCTRLFNGRYVFGFDWCHYEFSARPNIYFPVWAWHSRRCHRNPHFSMCFSYLCVLFFKESFGIKSKIT